MTQLEFARKNKITDLMKQVAKNEGVSAKFILDGIKSGVIVITNNNTRNIKIPCAVGKGLNTKINANIGTSTDHPNLDEELTKLQIAIKYGADTIMDLSVGGNLVEIRKKILDNCIVPLGTVPVYEIAVLAESKRKNFLNFTDEDILDVLEAQAKSGVDFFTIHAGITKYALDCMKKQKRILSVVSRGGAMIASWMKKNNKENPFFTNFDKILEIAYKYDVTLSLGDGLRPGSILDASDKAQFAELKILGELTKRARSKNVQVIIEGPGHVPLNQIKENMDIQKKYCSGAPFYILGPLVTDVGAGYDHITGAIGGALAASYGADFLCYVTPAEHLRHPDVQDVREGVIASKIAAHAADIVKNPKKALIWDKKMSQARRNRDWKKQIELSVDPDKAKSYRNSSIPKDTRVCTMCGKYCSIKLMDSWGCK